MYKSTFASILSSIAIFFGIIAIYTSRPYNWDADIVGIAFNIMFALVTFLIGWNIYSVLDAKDKIENIENNQRDFINRIERDVHNGIQEMFTGMSRIYANIINNHNNINIYVLWYINAELASIIHLSIIENYDECSKRVKNVINTLKKNTIIVSDKDKDGTIKLIEMIHRQDKIEGFENLFKVLDKIQIQESN